jgi:hypothetical protein
MSNANRMGPRPERKPTGSGGGREIKLPTKKEVKEGLLDKILSDTTVEPKNALSPSELEVIKLKQKIRTKVLEILERKAGLLAELEEIIDYETLLQRLGSFFIEMAQVINNLVSEINSNKKILGLEAAIELIKEIQNSLYLDPEQDGYLINKLKAELAELAKLSQNASQLEKPLNLVPRNQLALISDVGNELEELKRRVKAALERNNHEELKGLVEEILDKLKRSANYQAILISYGGNKLEEFRRRVEAARNNYEKLKDLVGEISALEIMQVYPSPLSPLFSERKANELRVEYDKLRRSANYQAILISDGGKKLEEFRRRVQVALENNDNKGPRDLVQELRDLVREILALEIMQVHPFSSSTIPSEREAYELRVEYDQLRRSADYQAILILYGGNKLEEFRARVKAALKRDDDKELGDLVREISKLEIMQVHPSPSSLLFSEKEACRLKAKYQSMIEEVQRRLERKNQDLQHNNNLNH